MGAATTRGASRLARELGIQREGLMHCVHCGFCLPACPTYRRLGDEADSPRGRLHLMRAVVEGRLDPASGAFHTHLDRCLGCRACEPVCPSGVEYGRLLELARSVVVRHHAPSPGTRWLLRVMGRGWLGRIFFAAGRALRVTRVAALGARLLPGVGPLRSARTGLAMLAATAPWKPPAAVGLQTGPAEPPTARGRVALLDGCVQRGLYARVNTATRRVLEANGFEVVSVGGQGCCGALHAHAGSLDEARALARANAEAFGAVDVDAVVVNAAGCGAAMKEYAHLLGEEGTGAPSGRALAARVRDVSELLAGAGLRPGGPLPLRVAYDHPCHLLHAQGRGEAPLAVLAAIPELEVRVVRDADECCGGAGIYALTHPELGGSIGGDKVAAVLAESADVVATPNAGCMMQIGAGLRLAGAPVGVVHPVELLDESYRRAGYYA